jgi:transcriptional regulator with GAF, ATPase, and Fis domain/CHASE2 domain-containing sensor protein
LLAEKLLQGSAKAVGFDIYWEPGDRAITENDLVLAAVLAQRQNIFGSFYFNEIDQAGTSNSSFAALQWPYPISTKNIKVASVLHPPDTLFVPGPGRYGFANLPVSADGAVREADLLVRMDNAVYPSFAKLLVHAFAPLAEDSALAKVRINYRLDADRFPLIPAAAIFQAAMDSALVRELRDCLVIVGVISPRLGFSRPAPVAPALPVVAIHAQVVENLLTQSYLRLLPQWLWLLILVLLGSILTLVRPETRALIIGVPAGVAVLLFILALGMWRVHFIFPLYAGLFAVVLFSMPPWAEVWRRRRIAFTAEMVKRQELEQRFAELVATTSRRQDEDRQMQRHYQQEITRLRNELTLNPAPARAVHTQDFPEIIRSSRSPLNKILAEIPRLAQTGAPVLITGESGTGKELIARAIHQKSKRAARSLIAVNCGAMAESLLEAELFGFEKGAFTGALQARGGFFQAAHQGTILLDEISAATPGLQTKLLRVLQDGQYFRVGSTQTRQVEVRVITASNRPLQQLVAEGRFREDLYFRLNVLPVQLPPLRERIEDIPPLLDYFLRGADCRLSVEAMHLLQSHAWPGNIRELQNLTARMRVLGEGATVHSDWVRQQLALPDMPAAVSEPFDEKILQLYRELQFRNDANTQIAARLGHLHRSTVTEYLKGMTFRFFFEAGFQLAAAIRRFNPTAETQLDARVQNRMLKYLRNLREELDPTQPLPDNLERLQQRMRKMPQQYHAATLEVAKAFLQGRWKL